MTALIELKYRPPALKMMTLQQPRLLKLRQYAIDGGKANICILVEQQLVDILGRHMPNFGALEKLKHFEARQCGLEAHRA